MVRSRKEKKLSPSVEDGERKDEESVESPPPEFVLPSAAPSRKRKSKSSTTDSEAEAIIKKIEEEAEQRLEKFEAYNSVKEEESVPVVLPTDVVPAKKAKAKGKSRKEKALEDFMLSQLPALKKEVKLKKKDQSVFNVRDYPQYFKIGGDFVPTYCLSLFNFLGKNEIVCTQYGVFEGFKHLVKTVEGFNHANFIITSVGPDVLTPEEAEHMMKRFGREWFKIPAKDAPRVSSAFRFGDGHQFKVILTGIYEDSFFGEDGEEIRTANPVLRYEPFRAPAASTQQLATTAPPAKKRKTAATVKSSESSSSASTTRVTTPAEEMEFVASLLDEESENIL